LQQIQLRKQQQEQRAAELADANAQAEKMIRLRDELAGSRNALAAEVAAKNAEETIRLRNELEIAQLPDARQHEADMIRLRASLRPPTGTTTPTPKAGDVERASEAMIGEEGVITVGKGDDKTKQVVTIREGLFPEATRMIPGLSRPILDAAVADSLQRDPSRPVPTGAPLDVVRQAGFS
jgi:hypothetical protein